MASSGKVRPKRVRKGLAGSEARNKPSEYDTLVNRPSIRSRLREFKERRRLLSEKFVRSGEAEKREKKKLLEFSRFVSAGSYHGFLDAVGSDRACRYLDAVGSVRVAGLLRLAGPVRAGRFLDAVGSVRTAGDFLNAVGHGYTAGAFLSVVGSIRAAGFVKAVGPAYAGKFVREIDIRLIKQIFSEEKNWKVILASLNSLRRKKKNAKRGS